MWSTGVVRTHNQHTVTARPPIFMFDHIQDDGVSAVGVVVISAGGDGGRYQDQHRPGRHHGLGGLEAGAGGED